MVINVDSVKVGIIYQIIKSFVINERMLKAKRSKKKAKTSLTHHVSLSVPQSQLWTVWFEVVVENFE